VLALQVLRQWEGVELAALITTITSEYDRVSMHGVRRTLLERQAGTLGLPLVAVTIPPGCANGLYEERWLDALAASDLAGVEEIAFGDLFLQDVRRYREALLARAGKCGVFPLWGMNTEQLARRFVADGFRATLVCVDPRQLEPALVGCDYDEAFLDRLPARVDPCGERGQFHTFVYAGPCFSESLACRVGPVVKRDGFVFCDLEAADGPASDGRSSLMRNGLVRGDR
jgi:diphthamide synthase (EF-2-diphthine--ammonia ligase)